MKKISLIACTLALFAFVSCSDDAEDLQLEEEQTEENQTEETSEEQEEEGDFTSAEVRSIIEMDETTSEFDTILSDLYFANGASNKSNDDCYSAEYFENGFVVTFNNCVLNETENINGTLNVSYGMGESSSTYVATFSDFFIGTTKVNGTRSYTLTETNEETISFEISSNINLEYEDGSIISESGTKVFAFVFEEGEDTLWNLQGAWTITKDGNTYTVGGNVSKGLTCEYWSQGAMNISVNELVVDIDFGDGTCDNQAVLTYPNGATQNITL
jgi:hypothetical protein